MRHRRLGTNTPRLNCNAMFVVFSQPRCRSDVERPGRTLHATLAWGGANAEKKKNEERSGPDPACLVIPLERPEHGRLRGWRVDANGASSTPSHQAAHQPFTASFCASSWNGGAKRDRPAHDDDIEAAQRFFGQGENVRSNRPRVATPERRPNQGALRRCPRRGRSLSHAATAAPRSMAAETALTTSFQAAATSGVQRTPANSSRVARSASPTMG